jgi:hypothetical protein
VRLARHIEPSNSRVAENYVELKRTDGDATVLRIMWRMLPRNGGRALLLVCSYCNTPRRHVYGWEWDSFSGSGELIGDAARVLDCATLPKAAICACRDCFSLVRLDTCHRTYAGPTSVCSGETSHARSRGFRLCPPQSKKRLKQDSAR